MIPDTKVQSSRPHNRHTGAGRYPEPLKNGFRLEPCRNNGDWFFFSLLSFVFDLDLNPPAQARREAQDEPEGSGCDCLSASEFHIPPVHSSIAGNPQGGHVGCRFFWLLFFRQVKKSDSPIKGEKQDSASAQSKQYFIQTVRKNTLSFHLTIQLD